MRGLAHSDAAFRLMAVNGDDGEPVTISAQPSVPPIKPRPQQEGLGCVLHMRASVL